MQSGMNDNGLRLMNASVISTIIAACLWGAICLGVLFRRCLPAHHLNNETKDIVKLAMGLVATMSALLLGLLISAAKGSYDTARSDVIEMAGKVEFLDRVLSLYGPEAVPLRAGLRKGLAEAIPQMWSDDRNGSTSYVPKGDALYGAIQNLSPRDDMHHSLKEQAASLAVELGQMRTFLRAQALASISWPLMVVVVCWLAIIFFSFSVLAPPNATANSSLLIAALSVAGAIFLILEMDRPFTGVIRIPSEPLENVLNVVSKGGP